MGDIMAVLGKGPKLIEGDFSVLLDMANAAITLFERVLKEGAQLVKKLIVAIFDVIKSIWNAEIDLSFISWVIEKVFGFKLTITEL
jgi:phage-related protein